MEKTCEGCGSVWKINVEDEKNELESPVTATLQKCLMCIPTEEEETDKEFEEEPEDELPSDTKLMDLVPIAEVPEIEYQKPRGPKPSFSNEADEIIKENYHNMYDRELKDLIKSELDEDHSCECIKSRRQSFGLVKPKGQARGRQRTKKYQQIHFDFLLENINATENTEELTDLFNKEFNMNSTSKAISVQLSTHDIRRDRKTTEVVEEVIDEEGNDVTEEAEEYGETEEDTPIPQPEPVEPTCRPYDPKQISHEEHIKKMRKGMSEKTIKIIEDNYLEKSDEELRELIADESGAFHDVNKIEAYRESNGMARPEGWTPEGFNLDGENNDSSN